MNNNERTIRYNKLLAQYLREEKNCHRQGNTIYIINYNKLKENDYFARVGYITVDEFMYVKNKKKVCTLAWDHANTNSASRTKLAADSKPGLHSKSGHVYLNTMLRDYPGPGNWSLD